MRCLLTDHMWVKLSCRSIWLESFRLAFYLEDIEHPCASGLAWECAQWHSFIFLFCSTWHFKIVSGVLCPFWGLPGQESHWHTGASLRGQWLQRMTNEKRWRKLGLLSLKKRGLKGHLTAFCNNLMGSGCRENRAILFSDGDSSRKKSKGHKLEQKKTFYWG